MYELAEPARSPRAPSASRFVAIAFTLLVVMNVALPKGGVMIGGVPITFGYLLLGAMTLPAMLGLLVVAPRAPALIQLVLGFLPLGLMSVFVTHGNGSGFVQLVIYGTLFLLLPVIMLLALAPYLERLTEAEIARILRWSIRFAVAWGIMNFMLYAVAHQFLRVPYLTVNAADLADVFAKNNRRGSLMKLVSTYNNGNIYGIVMVMLTPLYLWAERNRHWRMAFLLSIVLTLSRTAWLGLIGVILVMALLRQIRLTRPIVWVLAGGAILCISTLLPFMGWSRNMLVDQDLGGRLDQFTNLQITPFGIGRIHIPEVVYVGLLESFGLIGSLFAVIALGFPVLFGLQALRRLSVLRKSALAGCICYLGVAASDGAFILAPVVPVFLFLCMLLYRRGYAPAAAVRQPSPLGELAAGGYPTFAR